MSEYEPITGELREWMDRTTIRFDSRGCLLGTAEELTAIADRIDAKHEHKMEERADRYSELRAKMNNCYIELPVDADGEYIRIGDVLTDDAEFKSEGKVVRLMLEGEGWSVGLGCNGWSTPSLHEWHHHHAPTVEDVLRELLNEAEHFHSLEEERDAIAEYAAKLRLAESE